MEKGTGGASGGGGKAAHPRERLSQLVARWESELRALEAAQIADARRLDALDAAARRGDARLRAAHRAAVALEAPVAHLDRICEFLAACHERLEARVNALRGRAEASLPSGRDAARPRPPALVDGGPASASDAAIVNFACSFAPTGPLHD